MLLLHFYCWDRIFLFWKINVLFEFFPSLVPHIRSVAVTYLFHPAGFLGSTSYLNSVVSTLANKTSSILKVSCSSLGLISPLSTLLPLPSTPIIYPAWYHGTNFSAVLPWSCRNPAQKPSVAPHCFAFYLYLSYVASRCLPCIHF